MGCESKKKWSGDVENYKSFWKMIEDSNTEGHSHLKDLLENKGVRISDRIPNKKFWDKIKGQEEYDGTIVYETVLRIILENVYNGHELILHFLNKLVEKAENHEECSKCVDNKHTEIKIDIEEMFRFTSTTEIPTNSELNKKTRSLLRDLIDIQRERPGDDNIKRIFQHPVIEVLTLRKWDDYKMPYIRDVRRFAFLVLLLTLFVRLTLLGEEKTNCYPGNITTIEHLSSCSDWVDSSMSEEKHEECEPTYITANSSSACNALVLEATKCWLVESKNHCAHNLSTENSPIPFNLFIFKYKGEQSLIYALLMIGLFIIQTVLFGGTLVAWMTLFVKRKDESQKSKHNRNKMKQMIIFGCGNIFYLLLGNMACVSSAPKSSTKITICVGLTYFISIEFVQICILVLKPAVSILRRKGPFGFIKSIFRNRYFRDPDNYLEIIFLLSIPLALFDETWSKTNGDHAAFYRGIIAMGVFAGWMELFIKWGNVSHSAVGNFIKMFYNIIKSNLLAYMQACLLLMTAFSLAFWIILEGHIKKQGVNFSSGFWVNLVLTITMSVGEFNTTSFYEDINENKIIQVFAMLFLIGLVIFSTITMVNLLMSAIIYDYADMKKEVEIENLYFIAEYILEEGEYANIYKYIKEDLLCFRPSLFEGKLRYCPHLICISADCKLDPVPIPRPFSRDHPAREANEREPLLCRLLELRKGKSKQSNLCEYHGGKTSEEMVSELWELKIGRTGSTKIKGPTKNLGDSFVKIVSELERQGEDTKGF